MKLKTIYLCSSCQHQSPKWIGRCPNCDAWNSFVEDVINIGKPTGKSLSKSPRNIKSHSPSTLTEQTQDYKKISSGISEFDHVINEGFSPGSLTLLTGEPGIGKSTITLQIANNIAKSYKVLLISGEESINQIAQRAKRLNLKEKNLQAINEYNLETILETIKTEKPGLVIIDSIQVISSMELPGHAGSISQVRYCTEMILELIKTQQIPTILIGHVTKEGNLAGPRVLEHLVDTVLHIEGDRFQQFRILKSAKNRFGSCNEVGIFEMTAAGLTAVKNPSEQFLEGRKENAIGSSITITVEGTRPFLVEVQALVSTSPFGYPKRTANGFNLNRLQLLIAVLEKYGKLNLQNQDVFINVVGGIRLSEPAADLAVLMAIASSLLQKPLPNSPIVFGEVGLTGELRQVSHHQKRLNEIKKLGFSNTYNPSTHKEIIETLRELQN